MYKHVSKYCPLAYWLKRHRAEPSRAEPSRAEPPRSGRHSLLEFSRFMVAS